MGKAEFAKDLTQASFEPRLSYIILLSQYFQK